MSTMIPKPTGLTLKTIEFERLLDSDEAASLLKIHPKTLQRMAREGRIAAVQIGKLWRFRASALDDFLRQKMAS
jgi:excisionase family DNA binding protein